MTMSMRTILASATIGLILLETGCATTSMRESYTAGQNPTAAAGRGEPSLDDEFRPAAWLFIDGKEGVFSDVDGNPQMQWVISDPVSPAPTFRVEAFEPLLGKPSVFKCVLRTIEAADGSDITYGIASEGGDFEAGKDYSLVSPGEGFVIREGPTLDVVDSIKPLAPGRYLIAASVTNRETEKVELAVTYFTVVADNTP
jgi:hypothetical protein